MKITKQTVFVLNAEKPPTRTTPSSYPFAFAASPVATRRLLRRLAGFYFRH